MIVEPEQRVPDFIKAGADIVSIHCEQSSTIHLHRTINQVRFSSELSQFRTILLQLKVDTKKTNMKKYRAKHIFKPLYNYLIKFQNLVKQ